jgi:uncharacterized YigZ family protein
MGYRVPATPARFEHEIKKSRFIGIASRASSAEEAASILATLRREFPNATHHCWAYLLGHPDSSPRIRVDDDGEPLGTAGKPILNVLQHKNVGDVVLVVVRYFGGVKLGAGGLARAYSAAASSVMDVLHSVESTPLVRARLTVDFADEREVRRLLTDLQIVVESADYGTSAGLLLNVPSEDLTDLTKNIADRTRGRAKLEVTND